jgi:1-phosphatidylinositol-4-phosphate 5-kinase
MPTFHSDEAIFSPNPDILDLDPNRHFLFNKNRDVVNGADAAHQPPTNHIHESFDESSTSSRLSDLSDTNPTQMNGNGTRPTSLSSLQNVRATNGGGGAEVDFLEHESNKPFQNGTTMTLVDRTVGQYIPNGHRDIESTATSPADPYQTRTSIGSVTGNSIQQSPVEFYQRPLKGLSGSAATLPIAPASASAAGLATPTPSLTPATPDQIQQRTYSPHRFSSPPVYQPAGASTSTSSFTNLQAHSAGGLKHRHTLEVPKIQAPARGSRDGMDTGFSSGRFSPTTATAPGVRRASLSLVRRNTKSIQSDFPRDEIVPDEDAMRWAEAYRQKRASKRKRRDEEEDDRVLVGTKVDEHHANWVTAYNMLTGIRVSVSRTNAKLDRDLTDADFQAKQKSTFDM